MEHKDDKYGKGTQCDKGYGDVFGDENFKLFPETLPKQLGMGQAVYKFVLLSGIVKMNSEYNFVFRSSLILLI